MSRATIQRLGLLVLAIGFVGMTEMIVFDDAVFGPVYGGERISHMAALWLGVLGTIAGGLIATKLGAARTAILGLGLAAIGIVLAMVGSRELGSIVTPIGVGVFRPCPIGAAAAIVGAERLGRLRFLALSAASIACSAATDSAWNLGRYIEDALRARPTRLGVGVIVLFALAALCMAWSLRTARKPAASDAVRDAPYRMASPVTDGPPPDSVPPVSRTLRGVVFLLLPMMVLVQLSYRLEVVVQLQAPRIDASTLSLVRFVVAALATMYFVRAVRRAESWSPLRAWSYALTVFGVSLFAARWAVDPGGGIGSAVTGLLSALSTPFLWSIGSAYVALAVPPRHATVAMATWMIGVMLIAWPLSVFFSNTGAVPLVLLSMIATGVGLYLVRRAADLHRSLFDPPPSSSAVGTRL